MKKFLLYFILIIGLILGGLYAFDYYVPYSNGWRAGKLIKFSHKGVIIKTWEGQLSTGVGRIIYGIFRLRDMKNWLLKKWLITKDAG